MHQNGLLIFIKKNPLADLCSGFRFHVSSYETVGLYYSQKNGENTQGIQKYVHLIGLRR